ncbi:unnamed protein product [Amoebophrya sp. A25]|nr:unnamed protein product [Amoebophrya sp. A25]|eukprot:GSA25T00004421001.1
MQRKAGLFLSALAIVWTGVVAQDVANCPLGTTVWAFWLPGDQREAWVSAYYPDEEIYHVDWRHAQSFCRDMRTAHVHSNEDRYRPKCEKKPWEIWEVQTMLPCGNRIIGAKSTGDTVHQAEFDNGEEVFIGMGVAIAIAIIIYGLWKWVQSVARERHHRQEGTPPPKSNKVLSFLSKTPERLGKTFSWDKTLSPLAIAKFTAKEGGDGGRLLDFDDLEKNVGGRPSLFDLALTQHGEEKALAASSRIANSRSGAPYAVKVEKNNAPEERLPISATLAAMSGGHLVPSGSRASSARSDGRKRSKGRVQPLMVDDRSTEARLLRAAEAGKAKRDAYEVEMSNLSMDVESVESRGVDKGGNLEILQPLQLFPDKRRGYRFNGGDEQNGTSAGPPPRAPSATRRASTGSVNAMNTHRSGSGSQPAMFSSQHSRSFNAGIAAARRGSELAASTRSVSASRGWSANIQKDYSARGSSVPQSARSNNAGASRP